MLRKRLVGQAQETLRGAGARPPAENGHMFHRFEAIEPLPGSLHVEFKRCGKPSCRCARGELHGPYWTRRWREGGRQRREQVRPEDLERVRDGLDEWRRLHPPARAAREARRALRWLQEHYPEDWGVEMPSPEGRPGPP